MNIPLLDKRVGSLEEMMADLIATSENTSRIVAETSIAMKELGEKMDRHIEDGERDRTAREIEMRKFKEEMQEDRRSFREESREDRRSSKEEMSKFREEMQEDRRSSKEAMDKFIEDMREDRKSFNEESRQDRRSSKEGMDKFKDEMQEDRRSSMEGMNKFKDEMQEDRRSFMEAVDKFIEDMRLDRRKLNRELGEIAHKQGRMAEDLVSPSICGILRETFNIPPTYACVANVRYKQIHPEHSGRMKEFDVIAECGDYVMVNETKSSPVAKDVTDLLKTIRVFREYFPEHKDKKVVGCLATLYADKSLIKYASRKGILVLAVGAELMDVMNEPGFKPAIF